MGQIILPHRRTAFAAGTACVAGNDAQTVLLLQSNHVHGSTTITDVGQNAACPHAITFNGNVIHSTAYVFPGFGSSSLYFPGNAGDYLSTPDSPSWDLGAGNFCVEMLINFGGAIASGGLIGRYAAEANTWAVNYNQGGGRLEWYYGNGAAHNFAWAPAINTPYHVAFTRLAGTLRAFINGVQIGANTADATNYNTNKTLVIGDYIAVGGDPFAGYMQEVAVHLGNGVYPAGGFTPNLLPYCT